MLRGRAMVVALTLVLLLGAAPAGKPAGKPTAATTAATRPAATPARRGASSDAAVSAIRAAVLVLSREYEQSLRTPGGATAVREASNYFKDNPDEAVTVEAVVNAIASRGGGDPRTASYVKWQLLSALPEDGELDQSAARQLLMAYRNAPQPFPRPGIARQEQRKLEAFVQGKRQGDEPDIRAYLDTAVSQVARQNNVILRYRDELYKRLPKAPETFAAAMEDLMQRMNAAAEGKELCKQLVADVREWATVEMPPPQTMLALARAARRLADTKGPQYYSSPYWHSSNVFAWRKTRSSVDGADSLKDLAVFLEELAATPQLEVKGIERKN